MLRRRIYFALGLLIMAGLVLGACAPEVTERIVTEVVEVERQVEITQVVEVDVPDFPEGTELHIVQWSHFVPQFDIWFDPFAEAWGEANGVDVTVDHVGIPDLGPTLSSAIDAGEGPTMVEFLFAPSAFVNGLHDLSDVNTEAQERFGTQVENCAKSSYLPAIDMWYGFCHGWVPDPADYVTSLWAGAGYPDGPSTWADLLAGGSAIYADAGVPLGIGMSPELDSRMAGRALIWSYGGSIQDEDENVTIDSTEVVDAVTFMTELYAGAMREGGVFDWTAATNNQGLISGDLSYIMNSISAYRSLQKIDPAAADDIGFGPALAGPGGERWASSHVWAIYVVPDYVEGPELEAAKAFMLHLVANYNQATFNSELYTFPGFPDTVPQLSDWVANDPFGSRPADKLALLAEAEGWTAYIGFPGPANPATGEVFSTNIIPSMMARAALGEVTPAEAVCEAHDQIEQIFEKWRAEGLVGGTASPDCQVE
jgi:multiple sugar transport system substrate-binding protein